MTNLAHLVLFAKHHIGLQLMTSMSVWEVWQFLISCVAVEIKSASDNFGKSTAGTAGPALMHAALFMEAQILLIIC